MVPLISTLLLSRCTGLMSDLDPRVFCPKRTSGLTCFTKIWQGRTYFAYFKGCSLVQMSWRTLQDVKHTLQAFGNSLPGSPINHFGLSRQEAPYT